MTDAKDAPVQRRATARLRASLFTFPAVAVLLSLGTWQVHRLEEKAALIEDLRTRIEAPAHPLPEDLSNPEDYLFTKVTLKGHYLHDQELRLTNRILGKELGEHLVTPLRLGDGRTILVDRGWIPLEEVPPQALARPEGSLVVEGLLRRGGFSGPAFLKPENDKKARRYHWPELSAMLAGMDKPETALYLVVTQSQSERPYPRPDPPRADLPNNHLEYAITWYALALILVVIYLVFFLRRSEGK